MTLELFRKLPQAKMTPLEGSRKHYEAACVDLIKAQVCCYNISPAAQMFCP